ncbi:Gag-Pol polyprotein [Gossypium arboreum]|uniref:Gag-Pol polyprotein n=1 Tax=Gossypium arboreum TaxID=29729 RepID=A0A0B0PR08_GOSAR|nr:Gag-Pol polyprotein [Gossypium arboreum]
MEVSSLNGLQNDEEEALNSLLDAFGSLVSLNDIASAYCEAGRNPGLAGLILCEMQGIPPLVATDQSNNEVKNNETSGSSYVKSSQNNSQASEVFTADQPVSAATDECSGKRKKDEPMESSRCNSFQRSCQENGGLRSPKQKARPVSGGTVSSMLGKGYMKSVPLANGSYPGTKPMKVDSKEMPMSLFWGEELEPSSQNEDRMHKDMEDFLFKMLGEGFRLERDVIREVLNSCGYNMQKSMKKLLDWSAVSLDKEKKPLGESSERTNNIHLRTSRPPQENMNIVLNAEVAERQQKDRNDLQKEVLAALFDASERSEELPERSEELPERSKELPRRSKRPARRPIALGEIVERPLIDVTAEPKVDRVCSQKDKKDDEDEEDSFQVLRRAVKEYRGTMKEYYKAAVDAFAKGDQDEANKLLEQGQFFQEKARQADEESNQKIFETRNTETDDEMLLELHNHGTREAIQLLKCHLSSLAGIPCKSPLSQFGSALELNCSTHGCVLQSAFKYLKVIINTDKEDSSKGTCRRLVMKLLQKESISWSEGETSGIILIQLDNINPKRLSFAKN